MVTIRQRCRVTLVALMGLALLATGCGSSNAAYPTKSVTLIVPFPAGGAADQTARAIAEATKSSFPSGLVVQNREGGAGAVGMTEVVQAPSDGYKIGLVGHTTMALLPHTVKGLAYNTPDDYQPILQVAYAPLVLVARADATWKTMKELLDAARANPGKIRYGSAGVGTPSHIMFETTKDLAKVNMTHVPFAGDAPGITALLGGNVEALILAPGNVLGQVRAGAVQVLATYEAKRNTLFPNAPTVKEVGYDITFTSNFGIYGPKGMPDGVVRFLHDAFKKATETDGFKKFAQDSNYVVAYQSTSDMKAQLQRDHEFFRGVAAKLGLQPQ